MSRRTFPPLVASLPAIPFAIVRRLRGCPSFVSRGGLARIFACYLATFCFASFESASTLLPAAPLVPGLEAKTPLSLADRGRVLHGELRCQACHQHNLGRGAGERPAPDLSDVGGRVSPEYLSRYLADPHAARSGTLMPDLLVGKTDAERREIAEALTHFLVSQSKSQFSAAAKRVDADVAAGKQLFQTIGCLACHSPREDDGRETPREGAVELRHVSQKYGAASLAEFLHQPLAVRPGGRMPDMKLTAVEAASLASYLLDKSPRRVAPLAPKPELVAAGKKHFQQLNCVACHSLRDMPAAQPLREARKDEHTGGCLSSKSTTAPRYNLDDRQIAALRAALQVVPGDVGKTSERDEKTEIAAADRTAVAATLVTFNCVACHVRDDFGGVSEELNPVFGTNEKELGEEARIPPPLTLVGAKLQSVTLKKVLFDGESVRPYMFTRMPQFGERNLHHLPDLFARLDSVPPFELILPKPEPRGQKDRDLEKDLRAGGRELIGDKGLYCVACHTFNGKAPNKRGIDLSTFAERLKPNWYYHYMLNPAAFRPRAVMPTAWPGGMAVHKTILDGDTDKQISAIWYYLSLGTSAQDPSGIRHTETQIAVTDTARTYRGRSGVAGFRGIAVGFPERLHYAFNAETGSLTAVWQGDFIRVNWSGQGSGDFHPAQRHVQLPQDVGILALDNESTPWPLRPVMTKEAPANPDPLYPKNRGYQFQGYFFDDASVPTLRYRSGEVEIQDRTVAERVGEQTRLVRTITFKSPTDTKLWMRPIAGNVEQPMPGQYTIPGLKLTVPTGAATFVRAGSSDKDARELLVRFDLPRGVSTQAFIYELQK